MRALTRRRVAVLSCLLLAAVLAACGGAPSDTEEPDVPALTIALPGPGESVRGRLRGEALADALVADLGVPVTVKTVPDAAAAAEELADGTADIAPLPALTYTRLELETPVVPLVADADPEDNAPERRTLIVVPVASEYRRVEDLVEDQGSFAFGDIDSVAGSVFPRQQLAREGAVCEQALPCTALERTMYLGSDVAVARALVTGAADAGGIGAVELERLVREGIVEDGALRVIAREEGPADPWVIRADFGRDVRQRVVEAFVALDDDNELLSALDVRGLVEVRADDYHRVRSVARLFDLLPEEDAPVGG